MRFFLFALLIAHFIMPVVVAAQSIPFVEDHTSALTLDVFPSIGVLWGDPDGDGDLDVLVIGILPGEINGKGALYRNDGSGNFTFRTLRTNEDRNAVSNNGIWADIDNDGDLDLVTSSLFDGSLFINPGGPPQTPFEHLASAMDSFEDQRDLDIADYDGDGLLDGVIVRRFTHRNILVHNDGGFNNPVLDGHVYKERLNSGVTCWGDADNDGLPELYITNAEGRNSYFENQGGTLIRRLGFGNVNTGDNGTGCAWGDYDNDGDLDIVVTTTSSLGVGDYLFRNDGGVFTSVPFESRAIDTRGIAWGDVDNDGDLDLVATRYTDTDAHTLYLNDGAGGMAALDFGATASGNAVTLVDDDEDGDLDLFVVNGGSDFSRRNQFFRNATNGSANWLEVDLRLASGSNRFGVGAHVYAYATIGGQPQVLLRPMLSHTGRHAQSGHRMHFGLGDAAEVDSLVIDWPQGVEGADKTVLYSVAANQIVTITDTGQAAAPSASSLGEIPESFGVEGVFPNPSEGAVTISVRVGSQAPVQLEVFDVLGRRVSGLQATADSGAQMRLDWDGNDESGRRVPPGVYLIRVRQGEAEIVKRVTLLR